MPLQVPTDTDNDPNESPRYMNITMTSPKMGINIGVKGADDNNNQKKETVIDREAVM